MITVYLFFIIVLFFLAISDLVVGVSNDAVNFLNSAVGAKTASFKVILVVAALGILVGVTFSSGMMEVARKGIFHPEYFYFSEIIVLFLAVMITDVILLDVFNTFGMPTSTTVSIVFELLGAAVALSVIKIYTDPNAMELGKYINSGKALAIISGILLSVVVAFTTGVIVQYLTRMLFSFNYEKRLKYFGPIWGGLAFSAITFFLLIKGSKGASFMSAELKAQIMDNTFYILFLSFVGWTILLQFLTWFTKFNILKLIVLVGTFALAMAFAGNDLVNFIGVPLAGYNSYELYMASGGGAADEFLMDGLQGKVPTPTLLLLIAGVIMVITLWTSKKAKRVIKTSLDLGRQGSGYERFASFAASRSIVRGFSKMATGVNKILPTGMKDYVDNQFDQSSFTKKQMALGKEAPAFDMVRASVTLVVASILISVGTILKLPLSTTYVTFMVFMGTSLADGAWGRESAVYRVSGVLSVIGGWFFTAFSAFSVAFVLAILFYFGGMVLIVTFIVLAAWFIYRTHKAQDKKMEEQLAFEKTIDDSNLTREKAIDFSVKNLTLILGGFSNTLNNTIENLSKENLKGLTEDYRKFKNLHKKTVHLKDDANKKLDSIENEEMEGGHMYILVMDYLTEMADNVRDIVKNALDHVDNNHKPLLAVQIEEFKLINEKLESRFAATINIFKNMDSKGVEELQVRLNSFFKLTRKIRKTQIKRIKSGDIGTRNSVLFLNTLSEYRNLALYANRIITVFEDLVINPEKDED